MYKLLSSVLLFGLFFSAYFYKSVLIPKINYLIGRGDRYWEITFNSDTSEISVISPSFLIDSIYKSMKGPYYAHTFCIDSKRKGEIIWLKGYSVQLTNKSGVNKQANDYLCHNNFNWISTDEQKKWGIADRVGVPSPKRVTIAPGSLELHFPKGYGLPLLMEEKLTMVAQVLNLNDIDNPLCVRQKTILDIDKNKFGNRDYKPLYQQSIEIARFVGVNETYAKHSSMEIPDCRPVRNTQIYENEDGTRYSGHWITPIGREVIKTDVTEMLNLQFSTTLHYINVHVHPFAESLELRDKTKDTTLFKAYSHDYSDRFGVNLIDHFSSEEGVMMYKDHEYELICITNNTSGEEQDMMAVMYLYLFDKELDGVLKKRTMIVSK